MVCGVLVQVVEAASRKDLPPSSPKKEGKLMVENLKKNIQQFASDIDAFTDNAALLQVSTHLITSDFFLQMSVLYMT